VAQVARFYEIETASTLLNDAVQIRHLWYLTRVVSPGNMGMVRVTCTAEHRHAGHLTLGTYD
jgi:hypothetical protein